MEPKTRKTQAYQFPQKNSLFSDKIYFTHGVQQKVLRASQFHQATGVPLEINVCARRGYECATSQNIVHVFHNSISKIA